jgi:hypothetical protein
MSVTRSTELVLLGAGASVDAKVPAAVDMTNRMLKLAAASSYSKREHKVLAFVIGGLAFQRGARGEHLTTGIDVESVFNAIELLAERDYREFAGFVSWHPRVLSLELEPQPEAENGVLSAALSDSVRGRRVSLVPTFRNGKGPTNAARSTRGVGL